MGDHAAIGHEVRPTGLAVAIALPQSATVKLLSAALLEMLTRDLTRDDIAAALRMRLLALKPALSSPHASLRKHAELESRAIAARLQEYEFELLQKR